MAKPQLFWVYPANQGDPPHVDNSLPGQQPDGIWGPPGPWPTPPIHIPQPPLVIWGGGNQPFPTPPIYMPPANGQPPVIIWGPPGPWPTPPIHIPIVPVPPFDIWGPNDPRPTPPIHIPPSHIIWGGANEPFPTPPIYIPGGGIRPPLIVWGPPGPWPTPPIYIPVKPPVIWGGAPPWVDNTLPIPQPPPPHPPAEMPPQGFQWAYAYVPEITKWLYVAVDSQAMPHVEHH